MSDNLDSSRNSPTSAPHSDIRMKAKEQELVSLESSQESSLVQVSSPPDQASFADSISFSNSEVTEASALQTKKTPSEDVSSILGGILNRVGPVLKINEEIKQKLDALSVEVGKTDKILEEMELELQILTEQAVGYSAKKKAFDELRMKKENKKSEELKLQKQFKMNRNEAKQIQRELSAVKELNGRNSQPQDPHLVGNRSGISQQDDLEKVFG